MNAVISNVKQNRSTDFYNKVANLLKEARQSVVCTVNTTMVYTCFDISRRIVEEQQQGRANYREQLLEG